MIELNKIFGWHVGLGIMLVFLVFYFVFFPLCVAWSLNQLFNLGIAYTFNTWVAVTVLHGFFHIAVKTK
jgi:hypothetical protein